MTDTATTKRHLPFLTPRCGLNVVATHVYTRALLARLLFAVARVHGWRLPQFLPSPHPNIAPTVLWLPALRARFGCNPTPYALTHLPHTATAWFVYGFARWRLTLLLLPHLQYGCPRSTTHAHATIANHYQHNFTVVGLPYHALLCGYRVRATAAPHLPHWPDLAGRAALNTPARTLRGAPPDKRRFRWCG